MKPSGNEYLEPLFWADLIPEEERVAKIKAKTTSKYFELLKHPEWQRKRLEVLEAANFECSDCGGKEKTLHVHHTYYERGLKPWEYPSESLHCLCEDCHTCAQAGMTELHRQIGRLNLSDHGRLLGYARGLEALEYPDPFFFIDSYEMAQGIGDAWAGISADDVMRLLNLDYQINGYALHNFCEKTGRKHR